MNFKLFIVGILVLISTGCATYKNSTTGLNQDQLNALNNISIVNATIWGKYGLEKDDYLHFSEEDYVRLNTGKSTSATQSREFYTSLSSKEITPSKLSFVLCGYSQSLKLAFCDDAACDGVEEAVTTSSASKISELRSRITQPGVCKNVGE